MKFSNILLGRNLQEQLLDELSFFFPKYLYHLSQNITVVHVR